MLLNHSSIFDLFGLFFFQGEENLTTEMLAVWVNETLGLSEDDQYCAGKKVKKNHSNKTYNIYFPDTMRNWLHYCNFNVTESKKCVYFDGHERPDTIEVGI